MKKLFYLLSLAALMFVIPSCSGDDYDEPELALSKTEVAFANAGGSEKIEIESNKENFEAYCPESWVNAKISGTTLTITAVANETGSDRKTTVLVNALGATKVVNVAQSAGSAFLKLNKQEVTLGKDAKQVRIDFLTNAQQVQVVTTDEWINVEYAAGYPFFELSIEANEDVNMREGVVAVKAGDQNLQVVVMQQGQDWIALPVISTGDFMAIKVISHRLGYCTLEESPAGEFFGHVFPGKLDFYTYSEKMPEIIYNFAEPNAEYETAITVIADPNYEALLDCEDFVKALQNRGIDTDKVEKTEGGRKYTGQKGDKAIELVVEYNKDKGLALLTFKTVAEQPEAYETWNEIPVKEEIEWSAFAAESKKGKTLDEVKEILKTRPGYTYNENQSSEKDKFYFWDIEGQNDRWGFNVFLNKDGEHVDEVSTVQVWADLNFIFWDKTGKGSYEMTNEFKLMMEKEGFKFIRKNGKFYLWVNEAENIIAGCHAGVFKGLNDGKPSCGFQAFRDLASEWKSESSVKKVVVEKDGEKYECFKVEDKLDDLVKRFLK